MGSATPPDDFAQNQQQHETSLLAEDDEEPYNSEEDPDFDVNNPTATGAGEESEASEVGSESDAEGGDRDHDGEADARPRKRRKLVKVTGEQGGGHDEEFVMGELESGDEVTIREGMERRKKKKAKGKDGKKASGNGEDGEEEDEGGDLDFEDDDEAGGEGGFVRTRGMKMKMQEERRPLADTDQSTIDVDALWQQMNAPTTVKPREKDHGDEDAAMADDDNALPPAEAPRPGEETITIKRAYKFAGEVITEEKVVPKHSAEAKLYLASVEGANAAAKRREDQQETSSPPRTRRPLRRISRFDPNPPDMIKKNWEKQTAAADGAPKGPKLNTIMKSRLDWAAYVDREGIKDELDVHSKAKDSYLNRTDFLGRTEARKEDEMRNMRLKNMG